MTTSRVLSVVLLVVVMGAAVGLYVDFLELLRELIGFRWWITVPALLFSLLNYLLRFFKWHYFLARVGAVVSRGMSAWVFFAGLSMSLTPGKVGELLKAYLLKKTSGTPISAVFPVVIAERLTDLLSLLFLAAFGVASSGYGLDVLIAAFLLCVLVIVATLWKGGAKAVLDLLSRFRFIRERRDAVLESQRTMLRLVGVRSLAGGTLLSVAAWFAECTAFFLVLHAAGVDFRLGPAVFVYSLGTIAGAVSMLPGGLVATEAGMVFVLVEVFHAALRSQAVTAVLVIRICTLWFAVLIGAVALAGLRRQIGEDQGKAREAGAEP